MKLPSAKEILDKHGDWMQNPNGEYEIIDAMIEYAKQVLDYAAENAETKEYCSNPYDSNSCENVVDKESITQIKKELK